MIKNRTSPFFYPYLLILLLLLPLTACFGSQTAVATPCTTDPCSPPPIPPQPTATTAVCPAPQPLLIQTSLLAQPEITALDPTGDNRSLACQQTNGYGRCQQHALSFEEGETGLFTLHITELLQTSDARITDGTVFYDYLPDSLQLSHGMQQTSIRVDVVHPLRIDLPVSLDEEGCPLIDFTAVSHQFQPDPASQTVSINQQGNLLLTDLGAEECQQTAVLSNVIYQIDLPAGSHISDATMQYWRDDSWQTAVCEVRSNQYFCTAQLLNPLINQPHRTRLLLDEQIYVGTQLPASNLCILFR